MVDTKIQSLMTDFLRANPSYSRMKDHRVFSALCARYLYFANPMTPFVEERFSFCIPDGSKDGGIDAIFADPTEGSETVVVFQCKYYSVGNALRDVDMRRELTKLVAAVKAMRRGDRRTYNAKLREAFDAAHREFESVASAKYDVIFVTSWTPPSKEARKKLKNVCQEFEDDLFSVSIVFGDDLLEAVETAGNSEDFVKHGELQLFGTSKALPYKDSCVVNISARSLGRLAREDRALLGLNLRYHVFNRTIDKSVDEGMVDTVRNHPEDFWFYNNGIVIVCGSYKIEGKKLKLNKFSVVNGGQTTHNISILCAAEDGLKEDFPVLCKLIKASGRSKTDKERFCASIAQFTNSQKPIRQSDLLSNLEEHKRLERRLERAGVKYLRKAGKPVGATVPPYMVANMDRIAKIGLAGVLLSPGSSRSGFSIAYTDKSVCYKAIFQSRVEPYFYADLLLLSRRYQQFLLRQKQLRGRKRWFDDDELALMNNAETFVMASVAFLVKLRARVFGIRDYRHVCNLNEQDEIRRLVAKAPDGLRLFPQGEDLSNERSEALFTEILKLIFKGYRDCKNEFGRSIQPSNFFKRDDNFHSYVTPLLHKTIKKPTSRLSLTYALSCE